MYGCHSRRGSSLRSRVGDICVPAVHCGGGAGEGSVGGAGVVGVGKSLEIAVRSFPLMWSGGNQQQWIDGGGGGREGKKLELNTLEFD